MPHSHGRPPAAPPGPLARDGVERSVNRVVVEEVGGRRLRRFVVDCPRGEATDLSTCSRCADCRGYTLKSRGGSTVVCALPPGTPLVDAARSGTVAAHMTRDVVCVDPALPMQEALDALVEHHVHGVPVLDDADRPIGVLSSADVLRWLSERGQHQGAALDEAFDPTRVPPELRAMQVREVMTRGAETVVESAPVDVARAHMRASGVHRLVVVDAEGRVVGVVSALDLP